MMKRVNHIGIAVADLETAVDHYQRLLGQKPERLQELPERGVRVCTFRLEELELELIEPLGSEGKTIRRFLHKRGEGIHHICLEVTDVVGELKRLKAEGFTPIGSPVKGASGRKIAFLRPERGVLVELTESR